MYSMFSKSISLNKDQFCHYLNQTVFAWFHCPVYVRLNFAVNWNYNCTMEFNRILYKVAFEFPYPYDFTSFYFKSWTNQKFINKILVKSCSTGKSLSEALLFAEHGENILCTKIVLNVRNNSSMYITCSPQVWNWNFHVLNL